MIPKLTASGKNLLLRALAGETITFTKIQLGNGTAQDPADATGLANPILTVELSKITVGAEYVTLTAQFTNGTITSGFHITEAGFFATDPDDETKEILYAIGNEDESTADYVPDNANRILEIQFDAVIFIGDAENVSAAISSSLVYASKSDFDKHTANKTNPHAVTKDQVGLGNVPNLSPSDQVPTFTQATTLANIESGEKNSTLFGKIKLAISKLIDHINDRNNPHNTTASQVGAAAKGHTHNAQDINAGTLSILRGGTGQTSLSGLAKALADEGNGLCRIITGSYVGTGGYGADNKITLDFSSPPKLLIVMPSDNTTDDQYGGFMVLRGVASSRGGGLMDNANDDCGQLYYTWDNNSVTWYGTGGESPAQNIHGKTYYYFAIL